MNFNALIGAAKRTAVIVAVTSHLVALTAVSQSPPFALEEATVSGAHAAMAAGQITCVDLVRGYLARIEAYDKQGPAINAIIRVNPQALDVAADMDKRRGAGAARPPLHCIPLILKDNYDTADMPTTGGSVTLAQSQPPDDAFVVKRLRAAGAIVIAKANLTELARAGTTVSSLGGQTRNPYDLTRTAGGSSGGTGAAIAANFAILGTGSDTGQSIRSPASATSGVGLRPTRGLISRDGIIPLSPTQDEVGPMTRTVEDAARMLEVMAGYDPADPITAFSAGHIPASYRASLDASGLKGARIGLLTDFLGQQAIHAPVNQVMDRVVEKMRAMGATIVRVSIPDLDDLTRDLSLMTLEFQPAFNRYLASLGPKAPITSFSEFMTRGEFHPSLRSLFEADLREPDGTKSPEYQRQLDRRAALRQAVMTVVASQDWTRFSILTSVGSWCRWARIRPTATGCCRTAPASRRWRFRADSRSRRRMRRWACRSGSSCWVPNGASRPC